MPKAWSKKRERQYEHIKESEQKSGRSNERAKAIAAATVNKQRKQAGETKGRGRKKAAKKKGKSASKRRGTSRSGK